MDEKVCAYPKAKNKTFEGKLQKIRIITNTVCFDPMPDSNDEVEQH